MANYSTTLYSLIHSVARSFDDLLLGVPTGVSTKSTIVDSTRVEDSDYLNTWQVHFYLGTHKDKTAMVTDFDAATDTVTFAPAFSATNTPDSIVDATDYYQLTKRFKYDAYKDAINRAISMAQHEYLLNKSATFYVNRLSNGDFENSTTGWTLSGAGCTAAASTAKAKEQAYSLKLDSAVAVDAIEYQAITNYGDYLEKSMTLSAWVWCDTANAAKIRFYDGVDYHTSSYHTGGSDWELLTITDDVSDVATGLKAELFVLKAPVTAYFDQVQFIEEGCRDAQIPTGFRYISELWYTEDDLNFNYKIPSKDWWISKDASTPTIHFAESWADTRLKAIGQSVHDALTLDASVCYMKPEYVIQQARVLLMSSQPDLAPLIMPAMSMANKERSMMCTMPLIGSKSIMEL